MKRLLFIASLLVVWSYAPAQLEFINLAPDQSIIHSYNNGIPGGGVSFSDFNQDGWDDITLATGPGQLIQFYENNQGEFNLIPPLVNHNERAQQVIWLDFDNDGDKDFYVSTFDGINRLYENEGDLTLKDITIESGLPLNQGQSYGACWGDYNRDGWLDLYYADRKGPENAAMNECRLFKNNANGTFTEKTYAAGVADLGKKPFCSAFLDFDNDGWPDLYTAHDKLTINSMFRNNADGTFEDVSISTKTDLPMFAMCVTVGDYDNDGWQDIYVTNTVGNAFLHHQGESENVTFTEVAEHLGVAFHGVGWASNFLDTDNDSDLDLYVSGSLIGADVISSLFYENAGDGNFIIPDAGFSGDTVASYSNAIGDYNNDGYPDIIVSNTSPHLSQLWSANAGSENWIKVNLEGVMSNRDGVGSKIEVFTDDKIQMRYTQCGSGFLGQNSSTQIIGIASHIMADSVRITWPSGHIDRLSNLVANQVIHVLEGSTTEGNIQIDPEINLITTSTRDDLNNETYIRISPNPTTDFINIEHSESNEYEYVIYNSKGIMMTSEKASSQSNKIPVYEYPADVYFLSLRNNQKRPVIVKWIKL